MKLFRLIGIAICFSIVFALYSGISFALDQDEATVSLTWSNTTPYQGSTATATIIFNSNIASQLTVYYIGLHFDWMESDAFAGPDLSENPVPIPGYGSYTFGPIAIHIPEDATVGIHNYFVGIDGLEGDITSFTWDSPIQTLQIQNYETLVYNTLLTQVANNITAADSSTYKNPEAQSLLEQAKNEYSQALSYASTENWQEAITGLQKAFTYLEQANAKEQESIEADTQLGVPLLIGAVVAVIVIVVLIIILMFKRRRKPSFEQTNET